MKVIPLVLNLRVKNIQRMSRLTRQLWPRRFEAKRDTEIL